MRFYDREKEIEELLRLDRLSEHNAQFTVLVGRRRIGKTTLLTKAFEGKKYLYFFIGKKSEQLLCKEFQEQVEQVLGINIYGQTTHFSSLIKELLIYAETTQLTIIIDEFQRLIDVDSAIISDLQNMWDTYHSKAKIHLIASGSIYSMMTKIFEDRKEPLFGRKTARIDLKSFSTCVLKQILSDYNPNYTPDDLLMLYALTGGVAKYVAVLMDSGCVDKSSMIKAVCNPSSIFLEEGMELLVGEFGKRYEIYFTILQLIANGMTTQAEIDSIIEKSTGRYLETLEKEYSLIHKLRPMWAKPSSQGIRYYIQDCFLCFWFRFVEKNRTLIELGKYNLLAEYIEHNYTQYSGFVLEKYFRQKYGEEPRVTDVSHWWNSKGECEIDLIALQRLDKSATIAEVKRNPDKYSENILREKSKSVLQYLKGYSINYIGLSLDDM